MTLSIPPNALIVAAWIIVPLAVFIGLILWRREKKLREELSGLRRQQRFSSGRRESPLATPEPAASPDSQLPIERRGIYISYSRKDRETVDRLIVHLRPVLRAYELVIVPEQIGEEPSDYRAHRLELLNRAAAAIAVVSPDYLVLDDGKEIDALIDAHEQHGVGLLWFPARPSAVEATKLVEFQALINPGQALSLLDPSNQDIAFVTVAESLARYLERLERPTGEAARPDVRTDSAPRLQAIRLENIRCFETLKLDFDLTSASHADPLPSLRTVLVGDNATGKSTVLRAIALGLCDESGATALLKKMTGRMVRTGASEGKIELRFRTDDSGRTLTSVTRIASSSGTEVVRKSGDPLPPILLVGYGTQRTRSGTESHEAYDISTAVATLFDLDAKLLNPELVLLRQPRWMRREVQMIVAGILGLQSDKVEYQRDAIQIAGSWGRERLDVLSDGYRSTAQWILDLVNWVTYTETTVHLNELAGVVLIDELEQHLHPQWQRKILSRLREHLPRMQFFITSHSPLIASSVTGLDATTDGGWREKLIYLGPNEEGAIVPAESEPLRGLTVQQVLASPAFDYLVEAEPSVAAVYEEASRLASKGADRTAEEEERYKRVKRIVGEILVEQDTTPIEREARKDLNEQVQAKIAELETEVFGKPR